MKQLSAGLLVCAMALLPALAQADEKPQAAPADEYFGQMKMSILGIRNELHTLAQRVSDDPTASETDIHTAELVEDSLEAWAVKYPRDSWLPDACTQLETLYAHISALEGRLHLARFVMWMHAHLKDTPLDEAARAQAALLLNVPEHSADLAKASPAPSATP
jgi:hypothetical protein